MKSLAEQIRELMSVVTEANISQPTHVEEASNQHALTLKISDPQEPTDPDDVNWQEDIEVGIDWDQEGKYLPKTHDAPEEKSDAVTIKVTRLDNNQDIPFGSLSAETQKYILDQIYDVMDSTEPDDGRPDFM